MLPGGLQVAERVVADDGHAGRRPDQSAGLKLHPVGIHVQGIHLLRGGDDQRDSDHVPTELVGAPADDGSGADRERADGFAESVQDRELPVKVGNEVDERIFPGRLRIGDRDGEARCAIDVRAVAGEQGGVSGGNGGKVEVDGAVDGDGGLGGEFSRPGQIAARLHDQRPGG